MYNIRNAYKVLGVSTKASKDIIEKAFREKVLLAHPDRGGNAKDFNRLMEAYELIKVLDDCSICEGSGESFLRISPFVIIMNCPCCNGTGKVYEQK